MKNDCCVELINILWPAEMSQIPATIKQDTDSECSVRVSDTHSAASLKNWGLNSNLQPVLWIKHGRDQHKNKATLLMVLTQHKLAKDGPFVAVHGVSQTLYLAVSTSSLLYWIFFLIRLWKSHTPISLKRNDGQHVAVMWRKTTWDCHTYKHFYYGTKNKG